MFYTLLQASLICLLLEHLQMDISLSQILLFLLLPNHWPRTYELGHVLHLVLLIFCSYEK